MILFQHWEELVDILNWRYCNEKKTNSAIEIQCQQGPGHVGATTAHVLIG